MSVFLLGLQIIITVKSIDWTQSYLLTSPCFFTFTAKGHFILYHFIFIDRIYEFSVWTCWRSLFSILQLENKVLRDEQIFSPHLRVSSIVS